MAKKKKKSKKRQLVEPLAAIYSEDIGLKGIKRKTNDPAMEQATFRIKVNSVEKRRRLDRMERFTADDTGNPGKKISNGKTQQSTYDLLMQPLSSGRVGEGNSTKQKQRHQKGHFIGENTNLEKPYLRLTTYPKREDVRPLNILRQSLSHVKEKYAREEDFEWANEQLKSIRQDVTVQNIRDPFVLFVYETHARILLENGDLNEFNQCQTMIRSLTEGGSASATDSDLNPGNDHDDEVPVCLSQTPKSADEFLAYAMLYALIRKSWSRLKMDFAKAKGLKRGGRCCKHALRVVDALNQQNYGAFFRLYKAAPKMSPYLMDFLVTRVRNMAYERMMAAYRPTVTISHIQDTLGFSDYEEARLYLKKANASFVREKGKAPILVDCKLSAGQRKR